MASHIVGAELFYDYLGNNNYQFTLRLYRNCDASCGCAPYGDPEYLQIFDASGNYIDSIIMPEPAMDDTIQPDITNPCLNPISGICIEQKFYTGTYNLPPIPGGYTVIYQRCCRNSAIQSIPNNTGATYVSHVANDSFPVNSSPRFSQRPPMFICANSYLQFDNSATDPDGDSLSYSLVNALDGASSACPDPSPAAAGSGCPVSATAPPYIPVAYFSPYGPLNPTNSPSNSGNFQIDPVTGLLTGTPNQTGIFVVAVAVSEFRHGVYIDQTIRDYQFNIVTCNIPTVNLVYLPGTFNPATNYGIYELNCNDMTVNFNQVNFYNPPPTTTPLTYSWNFGVPGSTTDTSTQEYPVFTYPDTGTYFVTAVVQKNLNGQGCTDTAHALVIIYPILRADFTHTTHCQDTAIQFTDQSVSTNAPLNSWTWDFGDGQTSTQRNPSHYYSNPGTYTVTLTVGNIKGCTAIKSQNTIVVNPKPAASFTASPACVFSPDNFLYSGTGTITNYYWTFGNGASSTLQNPSTVYTTPGMKTVTLITVTQYGCRDTITQSVTLNPLPVVTISPTVRICPFTSTQLTVSGGVSYVWSPGASLSSSTISNPIASPVTPTTYYVTATNSLGCTNTDSVTINLFPVPQINAGPDTSVCLTGANFHTSVQLNATGGVSYVWTPSTGLSNPNIANPVSMPPANQTYYVTGTDTNGCQNTDSMTVFDLDPRLVLIVNPDTAMCDFDTLTLDVLRLGDSYYNWTPNIGISDPNSNSPFFYPQMTTSYIFTVQNYCFIKSDTAIITIHPLPIVATEDIDSVCIGGSVTLHATGAASYVWRPDSTLSGINIADPVVTPTVMDTYYVTGTDTFGCKNKDSVLVYVFLPPAVGVGPDTAYICQGKPVQLSSAGGVDYLWRADSTLSALNISNPIATPKETTWYYVTIYNIHQCHSEDSIQIYVELPITAVAESPYDICINGFVDLSASGGLYYLWSPPIGLSSTTVSNPISRADSSIVYTVKVSNDCFSSTATVDVNVHPLPVVNAGDDTTIFRNTAATLSGTTNGTTYYWYPADNVLDPTSLSTPATPIYTSMYYLYAATAFGCYNLDSVVITVDPYTLLLVPTAFTPNGDGVNDVFRIVRYLNIATLEEFAVYDRWGEKVFSTDILTDGWNGTYKGHEEDMGVYVWYVKALTFDGQEIFKKGNVTLVR
jgi:gliding motility-associated-like protein